MPSKITTPVIVRLENELILELDALAKEQGISRSSAARAALGAGLGALKAPHEQQPKSKGRKKAPAKAPELEDPSPAASFDLVLFAAQALETAQRAGSRKIKGNRIFIHHLWQEFERELGPQGMDLELFKQRLLEAHAERYLSLGQAEAKERLSKKDVRESETHGLSQTFHFLSL